MTNRLPHTVIARGMRRAGQKVVEYRGIHPYMVEAHVLGLKWLQEGRGSRVFNLGTGDGFSVREVVEHVEQVTKRPVPMIEGARRPGDCTKLVSGSSRAVSELGWSATRSNMKQMITDAWRWHQNGDYKK